MSQQSKRIKRCIAENDSTQCLEPAKCNGYCVNHYNDNDVKKYSGIIEFYITCWNFKYIEPNLNTENKFMSGCCNATVKLTGSKCTFKGVYNGFCGFHKIC